MYGEMQAAILKSAAGSSGVSGGNEKFTVFDNFFPPGIVFVKKYLLISVREF